MSGRCLLPGRSISNYSCNLAHTSFHHPIRPMVYFAKLYEGGCMKPRVTSSGNANENTSKHVTDVPLEAALSDDRTQRLCDVPAPEATRLYC